MSPRAHLHLPCPRKPSQADVPEGAENQQLPSVHLHLFTSCRGRGQGVFLSLSMDTRLYCLNFAHFFCHRKFKRS